ncbi:hypothetical protein D3C86_2191690 [compost metagenome]
MGSATTKMDLAISMRAKNATTMTSANTITVALTIRRYSVMPLPIVCRSRVSIASSDRSQTTPSSVRKTQ